jgi:hypothetical protein
VAVALDTNTIRARLTSHAETLSLFNQTLKHEPVSAPGSGLTFAVWGGRIGPVPSSSGLASTTARVEFRGRAYIPADTEPMDDIDIQLTDAVDSLLNAYNGDFTLGGNVRCIDLLGAYGAPLEALYAYLPMGSTTYRIANLTIPIIVNSVWNQVA